MVLQILQHKLESFKNEMNRDPRSTHCYINSIIGLQEKRSELNELQEQTMIKKKIKNITVKVPIGEKLLKI